MNPSAEPLPPVRRVVIAGGGTAGWMTAALLGKLLGKRLALQLVESDEIGTVGVGEATIPSMRLFHELLGLDEAEFMAATQAVFKLGIRFDGWKRPGEQYFHGFGTTGRDHWSAGFQHFWLKGMARGLAQPYGAYSPETTAALQNRFAHLPDGALNYAYHLDATRYARYLRGLAEGWGVQRIEGKIAAVHRGGEGGPITALQLENGARIEGDLFVDCTGFRALLLGETLGVGYEDWSHWLPCDRAVAVQTRSVREASPYVDVTAHPFGWQWRIPLQHRVGNGLVYSSREMSDADAPEVLARHVEGELLAAPRVLRFRPGRREKAWVGNCVAIGLSSGFLEPLESTSIYLIQRAAIRLAQMFPAGGVRPVDADEFNRQMGADVEHVRDFIILHYHVTQRDDSALWRNARAMAVPETLRRRIQLFAETGRVFRPLDELFAENSWVQVMMGQGLTPAAHHPAADLMGDAELGQFLARLQQQVAQQVARLPAHQGYVERLCAPHRPPG
ncbi:MAG: tryptophan 7-halogenase [Roseateles sp.]|uniref:tryptophan halogenase family protein n=1 Tax=Roseateles sp. TaxID=1971397 RepID=UPI0039E98B7C